MVNVVRNCKLPKLESKDHKPEHNSERQYSKEVKNDRSQYGD